MRRDTLRSVVFSRGRRTEVISFSRDYSFHSPYAVDVLNERPFRFGIRTVDGLQLTTVEEARRKTVGIPAVLPTKAALAAVESEFVRFGKDLSAGFAGFRLGISLPSFPNISFPMRLSPERAMYAPLLGAMSLGMVAALFLESSFGGGAHAGEPNVVVVERPVAVQQAVLGVQSESSFSNEESIVSELSGLTAEDVDKKHFEKKVRDMVKGYPIGDMVPYIMEKDRIVAIFLVAIAKKESDWGKRVPLLDGQDCYNYWGYRGVRKMMGTGGHTCFNSRKDAVDTVAKRLETLIYENKLDTPADLILWKCGSSCKGHSSYSVQKWISDVNLYYQKLNKEN
jgi:hypothetical protein